MMERHHGDGSRQRTRPPTRRRKGHRIVRPSSGHEKDWRRLWWITPRFLVNSELVLLPNKTELECHWPPYRCHLDAVVIVLVVSPGLKALFEKLQAVERHGLPYPR